MVIAEQEQEPLIKPDFKPDFGRSEVIRKPPHLSFSRITEYLICPGCYSRRKELRVRSPETRETVFGRALHILAGIVFRSPQRRTEMRYRKIEQLEKYAKRFLRELREEYPSWGSPERPYFPLCLPDSDLASSIEEFGILENDDFWDYLAYYLEVCQSPRQRLLARELKFSFLLKGEEGESGVIIDGIIDQVRQKVEGLVKLKSGKTKRKFAKTLEIWELKTHIPLREETQTPYGTLAAQMVLEGMGYRAKRQTSSLQLVAFDFSSGNYWILDAYDEEKLKKSIFAAHRAMGLYKEYNLNHKHNFGPQEARQPRLIEDESFSYRAYKEALAFFEDFRNSCSWRHVKTGAMTRDDFSLLAKAV